ncbi:hypothetical protein ACE3NQ_25520 [Paenibacillus terreus]|uniref:Uncharacterized protein n=1 Tax=Paenibacillus terreus TaxID=1387834 RepID=A0ABV5BFE8_9BACL
MHSLKTRDTTLLADGQNAVISGAAMGRAGKEVRSKGGEQARR